MKVLRRVPPTPEQLKIINDYKAGPTLIRGAAGSGKTTTALLRLQFIVNRWQARRTREGIAAPVRVLVLTYNRTLRGYINELAQGQVSAGPDIDLEITTFGKWSYELTGRPDPFDPADRIRTLGANIPLVGDFLVNEVEYLLGRYLPADINRYLTDRREGRGNSPRVDQALRTRIMNEVVRPYIAYKTQHGFRDWNDLAVDLAGTLRANAYNIVIVDEAQDFSANQVRAVLNHLDGDHSITFILDAAQRIYHARFFKWSDVGLTIPQNATFRLAQNHRNTKQIATFARQIIENLDLTDDGTMPDLRNCTREGPLPKLIVGKFSEQMDYAIRYIRQYVDLTVDSVAFLHPKGGGWFKYVRDRLNTERLAFAEIAREADWPTGSENIALSTLHSAKGLEFDHVIMLGLNAEVLPEADAEDASFENTQRLFAMATGRARTSLLLGYKADEAPALFRLIRRSTYELVQK